MIFRSAMKKLLVACDHGGLELKEHLLSRVSELPWEDLGVYSRDSVDYPEVADRLCPLVKPPEVIGVLICGSGQGMAMRANRYGQVRAALCWNDHMAQLARNHNDANVLCLGGRVLDFTACERILITFLDSAFEGGRHSRRVEQLGQPGKGTLC